MMQQSSQAPVDVIFFFHFLASCFPLKKQANSIRENEFDNIAMRVRTFLRASNKREIIFYVMFFTCLSHLNGTSGVLYVNVINVNSNK